MDNLFETTIDTPPADTPKSPKWKVYFTGSFWGHHGRDHAGTEIKINTQFDWAGYHWIIPAVYACGKGLVVDLCMQVDTEKIHNFIEKWQLNCKNDSHNDFTREQQMQIETENPLCLDFSPSLELNKKLLCSDHSCSICFNPYLGDEIAHLSETLAVMSHYKLNASFGWVIYRTAFAWATKRRPKIETLSLIMKPRPKQLPGPHFKVRQKGDAFTFSHPVSGQIHTLTVQELEHQTIPQNYFNSDRLLYPTHFISMSYTISPEPKEAITIFDFNENDKPLEIAPKKDFRLPSAVNACCVSIIGGSDGPTSIVFSSDAHEKIRTVCSALHFKPLQNDIEWHIVFNITQFDEGAFSLM